MSRLSRGAGNLLGVLYCAGLMGYALFSQHVLGLEPCPLCVLQRLGVIAVGGAFLVALLHKPGNTGARVYGLIIALAAVPGIGVAARHVWLQNLPPDKVPACGPGLDFMLDAFPLSEVLEMVLSGSGECAEVDWAFLGLSMPAWVIIALAAAAVFGIWNNWRRLPSPARHEGG